MEEKVVFQSIGNRERLVDRVANDIQMLIGNSQLAPGMKLPSEKDLSEKTGVSRTVIREAVKILVAKGLLETRQGSGTVVRKPNGEQLAEHLNLLLQTKGFSLDDLHQVRSILEVEIAGIAAAKASEEEISDLERVMERMEAVVDDPVAYPDADAEFHGKLAQMTHNTLLILLMESVGDILRSVRQSVARYPSITGPVMPDHRLILEAVRQHNVEVAREAMREHLIHARRVQDALKETEA